MLKPLFEPGEREYAFTRRDFERARDLIYRRAGIVLKTGKEDMVYSRLVRRLRALSLKSFNEYFKLLDSSDNAEELQAFTNALTTNLTSFFREAHHFEVLDEHLGRFSQRPIRIWCAAASTGEEPYSIAMTVAEHFGRLDAPVSILATDIDTQVLGFAERGVYPLERVSGLSREQLRKYFRKGVGPNEGYCRVADPLRRMVRFEQLNLLATDWKIRETFDAIFCRNVMIYFDKPTQLDILRRMMPVLADDGLYFAGHSESYFHANDLLGPIGRTVYRPLRRGAVA